MAKFLNEPSRTFNEYLLIPRLTTRDCTPDKISLKTPLVKYKIGEEPSLHLSDALKRVGFNIKRLKKCCALPDSKLLILNNF